MEEKRNILEVINYLSDFYGKEGEERTCKLNDSQCIHIQKYLNSLDESLFRGIVKSYGVGGYHGYKNYPRNVLCDILMKHFNSKGLWVEYNNWENPTGWYNKGWSWTWVNI